MSIRPCRSAAGFSLAELLVATTIMLIISSVVTSGLLQLTTSQLTIWNRTEMHSGVRSATELLQQEVGQSGRVALPGTVTLSAGVAANATTATVSSVNSMFVGERVVVDTGSLQETVVLSAINAASKQITISNSIDYSGTPIQASFANAHATGAAVSVSGGFQTGIVPPAAAPSSYANGSSGTVLKMYGDVNGDGNMVYIEYTCDTIGGNLYRNVMAFDAASKPAVGAAQVLLSNIAANPGAPAPACFQYQLDASNSYVLDVAITLTVHSQQVDPITKQQQTETKALLNVSPRNVFDTWKLAGNYPNRVQPTPPPTTALMP